MNQESQTFYYHTDCLGSTRLVTDDSGNIVSAITYHPFGESSTEEGSENHLFTGKERDSTGLYYYGTRYYDPEIGRFITRDSHSGQLTNPQTLTQYTYCANNPVKYIDPDGRDYFKPEWAHHDEADSGLDNSAKDYYKWANVLWEGFITKLKAGLYIWQEEHEDGDYFLSLGLSTGGGLGGALAGGVIAGAIAATVVGAIFGVLTGIVVELFTIAETYADLLTMGADCYQEASNAYAELLIYMLQKRYGDDWEEYCNSYLLAYYYEMLERKKQEQSDLADQAYGDHTSPPGTLII
ncbi:MAG: hypothetical protein HXS54_17320 [Theionarchaea archaeon]|nr:hypothetical protein [Theionarchaea archaeon]